MKRTIISSWEFQWTNQISQWETETILIATYPHLISTTINKNPKTKNCNKTVKKKKPKLGPNLPYSSITLGPSSSHTPHWGHSLKPSTGSQPRQPQPKIQMGLTYPSLLAHHSTLIHTHILDTSQLYSSMGITVISSCKYQWTNTNTNNFFHRNLYPFISTAIK